jgi:excisionase family DNA binding protein
MSEPLTVKEAASELGYHTHHVYRLLRQGTIRGRQFGQTWMIPRQEVERIKALQGPGGRLPKRT